MHCCREVAEASVTPALSTFHSPISPPMSRSASLCNESVRTSVHAVAARRKLGGADGWQKLSLQRGVQRIPADDHHQRHQPAEDGEAGLVLPLFLLPGDAQHGWQQE